MRFSARYGSFTAWKRARPRTSAYARKIIQAHKERPNASLVRLRGNTGLSRKAWSRLSSMEKQERNAALEVLRRVRHGESLAAARADSGLSLSRLRQHLGGSLTRRSDRIQRAMRIYTKGTIKTITVKGSRDASIIGEYLSAVRKYLRTGDQSVLRKFKTITITDALGKKHKLETDPQKLRDIDEMQEQPELFEIYAED